MHRSKKEIIHCKVDRGSPITLQDETLTELLTCNSFPIFYTQALTPNFGKKNPPAFRAAGLEKYGDDLRQIISAKDASCGDSL